MTNEEDGYQNLANAIILQAVRDFRRYAKVVKRRGYGSKEAVNEMRKIVEFIKSPWFRTLTNIEPEYLIEKLKEEVEV